MAETKSTRRRLSESNGWERTLVAATLLTCAVALSASMADPDLWGHVQYGRDVLRDGLPVTTTHSYTALSYPWINHENLAELLLAVGADFLGPVGMLVCKCLLGVGVVALILWNGRRQGASILACCLVAMLVAVNLSYFWSLRPQLLSFVWYALMLALFSWCFAGWEGVCRVPWLYRFEPPQAVRQPLEFDQRRLVWLWLGPGILMLWTNSHGGFVAGGCIWVAYLCCRSVEAWLGESREDRRVIIRFAALSVLAGVATLVNPYGIDLHRWLLADLLPPRPEILEWRAPQMGSLVMMPFWLILVTWVAGLLLSPRSRDVTHLTILSLTVWQSFLHQRHIPFFAIAFGFWMIPHVDGVLQRFRIITDGASSTCDWGRGTRWAAVALSIGVFCLLSGKLYQRLTRLTVDRGEYPVSALEFIAERELGGRMVVTFNWAQYVIDALGAERLGQAGVQVSFDGRYRTSYSQAVADMNFDFLFGELEPRYRCPESPPFDDERVLEFGRPDLVLIDRYQPHSVNVMYRNRDRWTLLYQDSLAQLWGRAALFDHPQRPTYVPPGQRRITEAKQSGKVSWPAIPCAENGHSPVPGLSRSDPPPAAQQPESQLDTAA